ncbi:FAD-dependent oxidoreductase [Nocardioides taihuensis]|uniref:FAD-dependent oxidoreductase n=1 Tax=Nocardioides taihuensis TaxID=1835606 RepID=A0ABW0BK23_9ACTN
MTHSYDVAVIGAGAMGSAAARALARSGREVLVLEQLGLGHDRGGSHGRTRIFRVGTEQTHYLEMAQQARSLWGELESELDTRLLTVTGAVEHGLGAGVIADFSGLLTEHRVDHLVLDPGEATTRWPGMRFEGPVLLQPGGAVIHADRVVAGLQRLARDAGATFRTGVRVEQVTVDSDGDGVGLRAGDETIRARRLVVTAGPWTASLLAGVLTMPAITATQEQPRLFEPRDPAHAWPCFVHWRHETGEWGRIESYGLLEDGTVKVGLHAGGVVVDPDHRDFLPEPRRDEVLRSYVRDWFPGLDADRSTAISCVYDNTDNGDFVIDRVGPVTVAAGFNGEGFKFVPWVGELVRDLVLGVAEPPAIFTLARHRSAR